MLMHNGTPFHHTMQAMLQKAQSSFNHVVGWEHMIWGWGLYQIQNILQEAVHWRNKYDL
jgi:hypothetical protein